MVMLLLKRYVRWEERREERREEGGEKEGEKGGEKERRERAKEEGEGRGELRKIGDVIVKEAEKERPRGGEGGKVSETRSNFL